MNLAVSMSPRIHRIAVSVFFFIAGLTFSTWASRIPDIKDKLHLSEAGLGSVLFALPVGLMASLLLSGWLVSKYGSRRIVIGAAIIYPAILVLLALASSTFQLVVGLFFFGLIANFVNIAMNTQAVGVEILYRRSIMASFHGLWSLAGFAGAAFGTFFVSQSISPFVHFTLVAIASGLLVLVSYRSTLPAAADVHPPGVHGAGVSDAGPDRLCHRRDHHDHPQRERRHAGLAAQRHEVRAVANRDARAAGAPGGA